MGVLSKDRICWNNMTKSTKTEPKIQHSETLWDLWVSEGGPLRPWLFLVPLIGGSSWYIITQLAVYTPYIPLIVLETLGDYMLPIPPMKGTRNSYWNPLPFGPLYYEGLIRISMCKLQQEDIKRFPQIWRECKIWKLMGVSENGGTPKSSILIGFSIINHPFWGTPIFWKPPDGIAVFQTPDQRYMCFSEFCSCSLLVFLRIMMKVVVQ